MKLFNVSYVGSHCTGPSVYAFFISTVLIRAYLDNPRNLATANVWMRLSVDCLDYRSRYIISMSKHA